MADLQDRIRELEQEREALRARLHAEGAFARNELERLQDESERQKALLDAVISHSPSAALFVDLTGVYRWVNPEMARTYGLAPEHFVGRAVWELFPAFEWPNPRIDAVIRDGQALRIAEFPAHPMAGAQQPGYDKRWDIVYVPVMAASGRPEGVLVMAQESAMPEERKRMQQERIEALHQADRAKDEFVSVVSHELRTPLNFIMGFASLLGDEVYGPLNDGQQEGVQKIMLGAERMLTLVNDLLDFARIQSGNLSIDPVAAALAPVVHEVIGALSPLALQKAIVLEADVPDGTAGHFDADRIQQVLTNLVGNAIKFTPSGRVVVQGHQRDGWLEIAVIDTGIGIPPDRLERLFDRFYQVDMGATRMSGGTGLGLAIARALVDAHGGAIDVESVPGVGSTFRVRLPVLAMTGSVAS